MSQPADYSDENAPETRTDHCDGCGETEEGTSHYEHGTVVLHLCHECQDRPEPGPTMARPEASDSTGCHPV